MVTYLSFTVVTMVISMEFPINIITTTTARSMTLAARAGKLTVVSERGEEGETAVLLSWQNSCLAGRTRETSRYYPLSACQLLREGGVLELLWGRDNL